MANDLVRIKEETALRERERERERERILEEDMPAPARCVLSPCFASISPQLAKCTVNGTLLYDAHM